ncbi:MAG: phage tail assembly chaperone [Rhodobacterales bacterium]|jgi:hypothetical protein|nr:phage tail assembly chaperone [Rhodobacterales bacterium]
MSRRLDWLGLMRAGMLGLHLTPDRFWALTPIELLMMLGIGGTTPPMGRSRLEELARAFPDRGPQVETDDARDRSA